MIQNNIETIEERMPVQEELKSNSIAQIETDSVLRNNGEKYHCLVEENSINISLKGSASLSNLTNNEFLRYQTSSVGMSLPQEKFLQKSSSCNDVNYASRLSDSLSCIPSHVISNYDIQSVVPNECKELESLYNEEGNSEKHEEEDENCIVKSNVEEIKNTVQDSTMCKKLMENNKQTEIVIKKDLNKEQKSSEVIRNTRLQSRPTLTDDSKLVKISLPTYPINIMQSNAQFLNKSRSFLNFITEKSTNIMEKALLPQHLTVKYNSVMKSTDNVYNEKKHTEDILSVVSPLVKPTVNNESDLTRKIKNIDDPGKTSVDIQSERNEYTNNYESKNVSRKNSNEGLFANDCVTDKNNVDSTCKLNYLKQVESHSTNDSINHTGNSIDVNGDSNMVLNPGYNNFTQKSLIDNVPEKEEKVDSEESRHSLLQQPEYLTLLRDYADLKAKHLKLQEKVECLEERNQVLESENKGETFTIQLETLQRTINTLTSELHSSLAAQETLRKEYSAANKERESMVMKYAVSEKQLIDTQRYLTIFKHIIFHN